MHRSICFALAALAAGVSLAHEAAHSPRSTGAISAEETAFGRAGDPKRVAHEMVLGRIQDLKAHAELMRQHPHMEHEDAWMAHVAPGKTESIAWQFTAAGELHYGCLTPGHLEAGMVGRIRVVSR